MAKIPEEFCEVLKNVYLQMRTEVLKAFRSSLNNVVSLNKELETLIFSFNIRNETYFLVPQSPDVSQGT